MECIVYRITLSNVNDIYEGCVCIRLCNDLNDVLNEFDYADILKIERIGKAISHSDVDITKFINGDL